MPELMQITCKGARAEAGSTALSLNVCKMAEFVRGLQVNQACHGRRRTYRAHGRINAYMSSPCHIEVILTEQVRGWLPDGRERLIGRPRVGGFAVRDFMVCGAGSVPRSEGYGRQGVLVAVDRRSARKYVVGEGAFDGCCGLVCCLEA